MSASVCARDVCAVCAAPARTLKDPQLTLRGQPVLYHACNRCGFTRKNPMFHPDLEAEKKQYDYHRNTPENEGYVAMLNDFLTRAVDPFVDKGTALDFGSGPGPVLRDMLVKRGFETDHYDPIYHPDDAVFSKRYDALTATEVFEHFHDPLKEIGRMTAMMRPTGILAVMTHLRGTCDASFLNWWYRRDPTHVSFYTRASFDVIAAKTSLVLLHAEADKIFTFKKG